MLYKCSRLSLKHGPRCVCVLASCDTRLSYGWIALVLDRTAVMADYSRCSCGQNSCANVDTLIRDAWDAGAQSNKLISKGVKVRPSIPVRKLFIAPLGDVQNSRPLYKNLSMHVHMSAYLYACVFVRCVFMCVCIYTKFSAFYRPTILKTT